MILKILRNSFFLLSGHIVAKAFSLLCLIMLARQLGVEGFGFYGRVMAYLTLFATIADAGMSTVTIRDVAQDYSRSNRYFSQALILRFMLSVVSYGCLLLLGDFLQAGRYPLMFAVTCGLFLFPEAVRKSGIAILTAYEHMHIVAALEVVSIIFRYLPFFMAIMLGQALDAAFRLLVFSWIGVAALWFVVTRKYCLGKVKFFPINTRELRHILFESYPFGVLTILSVIYFKVDIFMLAEMQGDMAVGLYDGAYKFVEASFFIPVSIINVLLPIMARSFHSDKASYKNVYIHTTRILTMGVLPFILLVTFFSRDIILLVFSDDYLPSASALSIIIWALFVMFINAPVGNIIATSKSIHAYLPYATGNVVFNIVMNLLLIPRYSFLGACIATVLTEILAFFIQLYFAHRVLKSAGHILNIVARVLLAGGIAAGGFYAMMPVLPAPLNGLMLLGVYTVCVFMFRLIDANDRLLCRELFSMARAKIAPKH